ncbi:MAG: metallophosphoesterase family protein [Cytophagales bacterium]|nr:metallophosphoesterase family protein [Cytophagales bacterium]
MNRKILIGDIHGCVRTFLELLRRLDLELSDQLILLGDYVDRGLYSKEVLDEVMALQNAPYEVIALRGNHEQMLISNYFAEKQRGWFTMADPELLESFQIKDLKSIDDHYIDWCCSLPFYYQSEDLIAVHAGLSFRHENPLADDHDLMWIRDWYHTINKDWLAGRSIVHGHTPRTKSEIATQFQSFDQLQVMNIDSGAFLSAQKEHGLGYLCAFDFTNRELIYQENIELDNQY